VPFHFRCSFPEQLEKENIGENWLIRHTWKTFIIVRPSEKNMQPSLLARCSAKLSVITSFIAFKQWRASKSCSSLTIMSSSVKSNRPISLATFPLLPHSKLLINTKLERRCASAVYACCLSDCHKSQFYQNRWIYDHEFNATRQPGTVLQFSEAKDLDEFQLSRLVRIGWNANMNAYSLYRIVLYPVGLALSDL